MQYKVCPAGPRVGWTLGKSHCVSLPNTLASQTEKQRPGPARALPRSHHGSGTSKVWDSEPPGLNVGCALDLECGPVVPLPYRPAHTSSRAMNCRAPVKMYDRAQDTVIPKGKRPSPHVGLVSMRLSITLPSAITLFAHS